MGNPISVSGQQPLTKIQKKQYYRKGNVIGGIAGAAVAPVAVGVATNKLYPQVFTELSNIGSVVKTLKISDLKEIYDAGNKLQQGGIMNTVQLAWQDKTNLKLATSKFENIFKSAFTLHDLPKTTKSGLVALSIGVAATTIYTGTKVGSWIQNKVINCYTKFHNKFKGSNV